jgi:hypothetical protein
VAIESRANRIEEKAREVQSHANYASISWSDFEELKGPVLVKGMIPRIKSRSLPAEAARSLLEHTEFKDREVVEMLGVAVGREVFGMGISGYQTRQAVREAMVDGRVYLLFAPLSPYTHYIPQDYSVAMEDVELAPFRKLVLQYCESVELAGRPLGDPFYWFILAVQTSQYRAALTEALNHVRSAIELLATAVKQHQVNDPDRLVEELADLHSLRQLKGVVFELRRLVRTNRPSRILDVLTRQIWNEHYAPERVRNTKPTAKRRGAKSTKVVTGEDVDELKLLLQSADESGGSEDLILRQLLARKNGISVYVYPREGSHKRPHFHVKVTGNGEVSVALDDLSILAGDLGGRSLREIRKWARSHLEKLWNAWNTVQAGGSPLRIDR